MVISLGVLNSWGSGFNNMVQRYGPFSPMPEVLVFFAFVMANVWMGQEQVLNELARRQLWDTGLVVAFVVLVTVLCARLKGRAVPESFLLQGSLGFLWSHLLLPLHPDRACKRGPFLAIR